MDAQYLIMMHNYVGSLLATAILPVQWSYTYIELFVLV